MIRMLVFDTMCYFTFGLVASDLTPFLCVRDLLVIIEASVEEALMVLSTFSAQMLALLISLLKGLFFSFLFFFLIP